MVFPIPAVSKPLSMFHVITEDDRAILCRIAAIMLSYADDDRATVSEPQKARLF